MEQAAINAAWLALFAGVVAAWPQTGWVEGRVVNASGGAAVRKATVVMTGGSGFYTAVTDPGGAFRIIGVPAGPYSVGAERQGWMMTNTTKVRVGPGERLTGVVVQLVQTGVIAGRVLDADGDPIARATVTAVQVAYSRGKKVLRPMVVSALTTTNDRGEYRIWGLLPGAYYVRALAMVARSAAVYFPAADRFAAAAELQLPAGAELGSVDIRFRPQRLLSLRIRLPRSVDRTEAPRWIPRIQLVSEDATGAGMTRASLEEDFVVVRDLIPGRYRLSLLLPDRDAAGGRLYLWQYVDVVDGDREITPEFQRALEVPGKVEGVAVKRIELAPEESAMAGMTVTVGADGGFLFREVMPDRFELRVSGAEGTYLRAIRLDGRELSTQSVDLTRGGGRLSVALGTDGGEVAGIALRAEGEPASRATVALAPVRAGWPDLLRTATADEHGNFRLESIAPGEYRLFAWASPPAGAAESPEFRARYEAGAIRLRVDADSEQRVTVKASAN